MGLTLRPSPNQPLLPSTTKAMSTVVAFSCHLTREIDCQVMVTGLTDVEPAKLKLPSIWVTLILSSLAAGPMASKGMINFKSFAGAAFSRVGGGSGSGRRSGCGNGLTAGGSTTGGLTAG